MIDSVKTQLKQLMDRADALSLRERALLFIGVMAVIYIIATNVLFSPLRAEHNRANDLLKAKNEQIQSMNREMQTLLGAGTDASTSEQQQIAALDQQLKELDQQLERVVGGMVSPQQMAKLLEQALARHPGIQLVRLENLPKSVATSQAVAGSADGKVAGAVLYRHGLRIQVKGRYFDVVNYLKTLETLPWRVYWGEVALNAEKHPISSVTFVIYTLSRQSGWIGV